MAIINIFTGYSADDFATMQDVAKHFNEKLASGTKVTAGRIDLQMGKWGDEEWVVRVKTTKKELSEIMARIMTDHGEQVNELDLEDLVDEVWAEGRS